MVKVGLISLGCAKNLIDSEIMLGHLRRAGMELADEPEDADVLVVNTCSFIDAAKRESIEAIQDAARRRRGGPRRKLIVAGCLAQRFATELPALMPEVDAFIGLDQVTKVHEVIEGLMAQGRARASKGQSHVTDRPAYVPDWDTPRVRLTPRHSAYIKIAEGCNHPCSFCIIPKIRGRHRSRTQESIVREARELVAQGCREINLISQATTYFGMDRWDGRRPNPRSGVDSSRGESLSTLLRELDAIEGDFWIRLLYTHPAHWSDELMDAVAGCSKVAKYVDIPLQHISDNMLRLMHRETDSAYIRELLRRMRARIPGLGIRTTFIVGFPGETQADFDELMAFVEEAQFERAGVFQYSREEGTRAYDLPDRVHHMTRVKRWNTLSAKLHILAHERNQQMLGKTLRVLVDKPGEARTAWDAPEIDGCVEVDEELPVGTFADVVVNDWEGYALFAKR